MSDLPIYGDMLPQQSNVRLLPIVRKISSCLDDSADIVTSSSDPGLDCAVGKVRAVASSIDKGTVRELAIFGLGEDPI
jgi:hypothetical protein